MSADIKSALHAFLSSRQALAALVADRIHPRRRPQGGDLPCVVYRQVSGGTLGTLGGISGLAAPTFAIDCYGASEADAEAVAQAVRGRRGDAQPGLDGFRGEVTAADDTQVRIQVARLVEMADDYLPNPHADDEGTYVTTLPFRIWYEDLAVAS